MKTGHGAKSPLHMNNYILIKHCLVFPTQLFSIKCEWSLLHVTLSSDTFLGNHQEVMSLLELIIFLGVLFKSQDVHITFVGGKLPCNSGLSSDRLSALGLFSEWALLPGSPWHDPHLWSNPFFSAIIPRLFTLHAHCSMGRKWREKTSSSALGIQLRCCSLEQERSDLGELGEFPRSHRLFLHSLALSSFQKLEFLQILDIFPFKSISKPRQDFSGMNRLMWAASSAIKHQGLSIFCNDWLQMGRKHN